MKPKKPVLTSEQRNSVQRAITKANRHAWDCRADEANKEVSK